MKCIRAKLGQFKMRTQILIINGIILSLLIPSLLIVQTVNRQQVEQILKDYLKRNTIQEISKQLNSTSKLLSYQLNSAFQRTEITLTNLNQLYWLQQKNDIISTSQIPRMCDYIQQTMSEEQNYSILCFSTFGYESKRQIPYSKSDISQTLSNFTNTVNSLILSLMRLNDEYLPNQIYFFSTIHQNQYGVFYPQITVDPNFDPKQREWYKSHFKNLEKDNQNHTQLSNVYRYFDPQTIQSITMTQSMLNLNKEVEGLFCSDMIFQNSIIPQLNINIMIVNVDGILILSNYKNYMVSNQQNLIRFDDEDITGFTNQDWNSILNYYYNQQSISTCNYNQNFEIFCRFNSIYNKDVVIQITKLQDIDYFLILFYDIQIEKDIEENINILIQIINNNFSQMILITVLVYLGLILFQVILIYFIFLPMYQIIRQSQSFLNKQQKSKQFQKQHLLQQINEFHERLITKRIPLKNSLDNNNNTLMQFNFQFNTLFDRVLAQRMCINPQCKILQQFKYPRKGIHRPLDIIQIIKEGNINDNCYDQQIVEQLKILLVKNHLQFQN